MLRVHHVKISAEFRSTAAYFTANDAPSAAALNAKIRMYSSSGESSRGKKEVWWRASQVILITYVQSEGRQAGSRPPNQVSRIDK